MPKLEEWSVMTGASPYQAPERASTVLSGKIYNDDRFKDGTKITTSSIKMLDIHKKKARTKNTEYDLGEPSKEWLEWLDKSTFKLEDYHHPEEVDNGSKEKK